MQISLKKGTVIVSIAILENTLNNHFAENLTLSQDGNVNNPKLNVELIIDEESYSSEFEYELDEASSRLVFKHS
jgi:hypothetical protein